MSDEDLAAFTKVAGDRKPPNKRVRELWCLIGRRSGKSRIAAALAVFIACFVKHHLARGEVGTVLVLAASQAQAKVVFDYCLGYLTASPVLKSEIASTTTTEIRLRNGNVIAVHPNSYRTVRGKTLLCAIFDEVAIWRDADSALPDIETYRAVLPSLVTTNGMLIGISSPYRKTGLLYQKHRDHFGQDSDDVLVVQAPSRVFNPTLDEQIIAAAISADPEAAIAEWEGEFRSDISSFLDDEIIERAVDYSRPLEMPPRRGRLLQVLCRRQRRTAATPTRSRLRTRRATTSSSTWCAGPRRPSTLRKSRDRTPRLCKEYRVSEINRRQLFR